MILLFIVIWLHFPLFIDDSDWKLASLEHPGKNARYRWSIERNANEGRSSSPGWWWRGWWGWWVLQQGPGSRSWNSFDGFLRIASSNVDACGMRQMHLCFGADIGWTVDIGWDSRGQSEISKRSCSQVNASWVWSLQSGRRCIWIQCAASIVLSFRLTVLRKQWWLIHQWEFLISQISTKWLMSLRVQFKLFWYSLALSNDS